MLPILLILLASATYANEEITVELPGGATMEMVWIEPGTFVMGSPDSEWGRGDNPWSTNEGPQHDVRISQGFYLGKCEVTRAQWESVMGTQPWQDQGDPPHSPQLPANYISRRDAQEFIDLLNEAPANGVSFRLPFDAEWEWVRLFCSVD